MTTSDERFLVTGAGGCIGSWVVRQLAADNVPVVAMVRSPDHRRLELVATEEQLARVRFVMADVTDTEAVARVVAEERVTHVIHCAALQVPFVRADPPEGARVNVLGTVNVFEAVRRSNGVVRGLAYASSAAVYGPASDYPDGVVTDDSPLYPERANLYGVFKQANEGTAQIYASELGIPSIGLRPFVVYGPGRDQGMTSTPTVAMVAAAAGRPYRISFGGSVYYHFAPDAADAFISAARTATAGARVYNIPGLTASMAEVVAAIESAEPRAAGTITFEPTQPPTPFNVDVAAAREALGPLSETSLRDGVAQTLDTFRDGLRRGLVAPPSA